MQHWQFSRAKGWETMGLAPSMDDYEHLAVLDAVGHGTAPAGFAGASGKVFKVELRRHKTDNSYLVMPAFEGAARDTVTCATLPDVLALLRQLTVVAPFDGRIIPVEPRKTESAKGAVDAPNGHNGVHEQQKCLDACTITGEACYDDCDERGADEECYDDCYEDIMACGEDCLAKANAAFADM